MKNHQLLVKNGPLGATWATLGPRCVPRDSQSHMFEDFEALLAIRLAANIVKNACFLILFWDPLRRGFWKHWASIWRAFGHNFGDFLGPEGKSENCAIAAEWTLPRRFERVTFSTCFCTFSSIHFWHDLFIVFLRFLLPLDNHFGHFGQLFRHYFSSMILRP